METYAPVVELSPVVEWSRQHHKKVADYWQLVAKYQAKFRQDPITWVIGHYIQLNRTPIHELSDRLSAKKEAMFNCIKDTPIDSLDLYRAKLVKKHRKINDVEKKSKLEEKIGWLAYFIFCGESRGGKLAPKKHMNTHHSGEEMYDLLKEYLISERLKTDPYALQEVEEFNFDQQLRNEITIKKEEGFAEDKLIEAVVDQILEDYHDEAFDSLSWGEFSDAFEQHITSRKNQGAIEK